MAGYRKTRGQNLPILRSKIMSERRLGASLNRLGAPGACEQLQTVLLGGVPDFLGALDFFGASYLFGGRPGSSWDCLGASGWPQAALGKLSGLSGRAQPVAWADFSSVY